jgi:hypothetical protein
MLRPVVCSIAAACAAAAYLAVPPPAQSQAAPRARIWVQDERDLFRRGDRMEVRFTSSRDAHVAVIHIDTDGTLDFLYPANSWDDGYVRGGQVYSVPRGRHSAWAVRSRPGIGYLYMIASDQPLDFSYFGGPYGGSWDWSFAGRNVRGDPYLALEQITRILVPDWGYGGYSVDYYSYHVDQRHNYPLYACGSTAWGIERGWGWTSHYGPCDRLVVFLRERPGYYDTRRNRVQGRGYLQGESVPEVRHGYKAPARESAGARALVPSARGTWGGAEGSPSSAPVQPSRQRPTLERRGGDDSADSGATTRARGMRPRPQPTPTTPKVRGSGGGEPSAPRATPSGRGGGEPPAPVRETPRARGSGGGGNPVSPVRETPRARGSGGGASVPPSEPAAGKTRSGRRGGGGA